jgi:hypothetical protein
MDFSVYVGVYYEFGNQLVTFRAFSAGHHYILVVDY